MHGLLRCNINAGVRAHARSGRVTQRCRNRNPRWETGLGNVNDVTHRKRAQRILGDLKKSVELRLDTERVGSTFGARRGQTNLRATGAARDGGADGKARIERMCISLLMSKNL